MRQSWETMTSVSAGQLEVSKPTMFQAIQNHCLYQQILTIMSISKWFIFVCIKMFWLNNKKYNIKTQI